MASYHIEGPSIGKRSVALSPPIAQGMAGTIHRVVGETGIVVKLYKDPKDLSEYSEKIAAMLAAPPDLSPVSHNGRTYVQIAWPLGTVGNGRGDFIGFVMPEIDIQASTDLENILQKAMRTRKGIPEFYGARVLLAANLAALMAELHGSGHYMVDMKPINMRFYPHAWYMAILDTDGFSINGQRRLPAHQFSDEYIAPEARGVSPERLGLEQDLFALGTIIFRLINNGLHPFQGVDLRANQPTTLQERIFAGLYAYGLTPHRDVKPAPSSIHEFLEPETRRLFDRTFLSKSGRPTAVEWRDHIKGMISNKVLLQCKVVKDHAHFSLGCGLCHLTKTARQAAPLQRGAATTQLGPGSITGLPVGPGQSASGAIVEWLKDNTKIVAAAVGIIVLVLWWLAPSQTPTTAPGPTRPPQAEPVRLPPATPLEPVQPPPTSVPAPDRPPPAATPQAPVRPPPTAAPQAPVRLPPTPFSQDPVRPPPAASSQAPVRLPSTPFSQDPGRPPPNSSQEPVRLPKTRF